MSGKPKHLLQILANLKRKKKKNLATECKVFLVVVVVLGSFSNQRGHAKWQNLNMVCRAARSAVSTPAP